MATPSIAASTRTQTAVGSGSDSGLTVPPEATASWKRALAAVAGDLGVSPLAVRLEAFQSTRTQMSDLVPEGEAAFAVDVQAYRFEVTVAGEKHVVLADADGQLARRQVEPEVLVTSPDRLQPRTPPAPVVIREPAAPPVPPPAVTGPVTVPAQARVVFEAAKVAAAAELGVAPDALTLTKFLSTMWSASDLVPPDEPTLGTFVQGYQFVFEAGGRSQEMRADVDGVQLFAFKPSEEWF